MYVANIRRVLGEEQCCLRTQRQVLVVRETPEDRGHEASQMSIQHVPSGAWCDLDWDLDSAQYTVGSKHPVTGVVTDDYQHLQVTVERINCLGLQQTNAGGEAKLGRALMLPVTRSDIAAAIMGVSQAAHGQPQPRVDDEASYARYQDTINKRKVELAVLWPDYPTELLEKLILAASQAGWYAASQKAGDWVGTMAQELHHKELDTIVAYLHQATAQLAPIDRPVRGFTFDL